MSTVLTTPLSVSQAIRERRATKKFKTTPLPPGTLDELLALTLAAPSSWNLQDWSIFLVREPEQKAALAQAAWNQQQIVDAPVTFVFVANDNAHKDGDFDAIAEHAQQAGAWPEQMVGYLKQNMPAFQDALQQAGKAREYAVKDAALAAAHLMIAAQSLGLNTCPMNGWMEDQVKTILGIADQPHLAVALVVPVGYAEITPADPGRLPVSKRVYQGTMSQPYAG